MEETKTYDWSELTRHMLVLGSRYEQETYILNLLEANRGIGDGTIFTDNEHFALDVVRRFPNVRIVFGNSDVVDDEASRINESMFEREPDTDDYRPIIFDNVIPRNGSLECLLAFARRHSMPIIIAINDIANEPSSIKSALIQNTQRKLYFED